MKETEKIEIMNFDQEGYLEDGKALYETYAMCGRKVALAQEKLDVVALSTRDAGLLQVEPGSLALSLECLSFDEQGRPVEHACALNTGRRSGYTYEY